MRPVLLVALLVLTAGCGAYQFPGETPAPGDAHVSGTVRSVPCAPVEQAGASCAGKPVPGLKIEYVQGSTTVRRAVTDSNGAYAVDVPPGDYTVKLNTYMRIVSGPTRLALGPDNRKVADYVLDNGIRVPAAEPAST